MFCDELCFEKGGVVIETFPGFFMPYPKEKRAGNFLYFPGNIRSVFFETIWKRLFCSFPGKYDRVKNKTIFLRAVFPGKSRSSKRYKKTDSQAPNKGSGCLFLLCDVYKEGRKCRKQGDFALPQDCGKIEH